MTYGALKLRLTQMFPGLSLDLVEGFIGDRYSEILGELPWTSRNFTTTLPLQAPYVTGTVAVTLGSDTVTLTGGTWPAEFSGRSFRAAARPEFYQFTRVTDTVGTIERPYEGPNATGAGYSIFQSVYHLPADARLLQDTAFDPLKRFSLAKLNEVDPRRQASGTPQAWASYMEDSQTPPLMQVEIWPIPDVTAGLPYTYAGEIGGLSDATDVVEIWLQPAALVEGCISKIKAHLKDIPGAQFAKVNAAEALKLMRRAEAQGSGPTHMQLSSYFTAHRAKRWCR